MQSQNVPKYDLKGVKGKIHMMREVVIPPFATIMVKGVAKLMTHSNHMNVVIEPIVEYSDPIAMARFLWQIETGNRQNKCLPKNSQCKANNSPKADCCGRDCNSKCHSGSVATDANRV